MNVERGQDHIEVPQIIEVLQNTAEQQPVTPEVTGIFISPNAGVPMQEVDSVMAIAGVGLQGDRYAVGKGAYSRAKRETIRHVALVSEEAIEEANTENGTDFTPAETRRNLIVRGIDLNGLIGREFSIGEVVMQGIELCDPCARPSNLSSKKGFEPAFQGRGGLRAAILTDGEIKKTDAITVSEKEDMRPEWLRDNQVGMGSMKYGDEVYPFTIASKDIEPRLPGFVGFPNNEFLFISEEVPKEYREFVLGHEIREFKELAGQEGRCAASLQAELAGVPEDMKETYTAYRRTFFENLVAYYQNVEDESMREFKEEMQGSLDYLKSLTE